MCFVLFVLIIFVMIGLKLRLVSMKRKSLNTLYMKKNDVFRVRVLHSYPLIGETYYNNLTWQQAVEKFEFLVSACLTFSEINVRCVNIIKGKRKSIKMFQNHE